MSGLAVVASSGISTGRRAAHQFERRDTAVEPDVIASILHGTARMGDGGEANAGDGQTADVARTKL
jgi:hypothetical protein